MRFAEPADALPLAEQWILALRVVRHEVPKQAQDICLAQRMPIEAGEMKGPRDDLYSRVEEPHTSNTGLVRDLRHEGERAGADGNPEPGLCVLEKSDADVFVSRNEQYLRSKRPKLKIEMLRTKIVGNSSAMTAHPMVQML